MEDSRTELIWLKSFVDKKFINTRANTRTSDFYVNYFFNQANSGNKLKWNWWAFLLTPVWFFYKKMHIPGLLLGSLGFVLTYLSFILANHFQLFQEGFWENYAKTGGMIPFLIPATCLALLLVTPVLAGCYGNWLYFLRFKRTVQMLSDQTDAQTYLSKKGGSSWLSAMAAVLILVATVKLIQGF